MIPYFEEIDQTLDGKLITLDLLFLGRAIICPDQSDTYIPSMCLPLYFSFLSVTSVNITFKCSRRMRSYIIPPQTEIFFMAKEA